MVKLNYKDRINLVTKKHAFHEDLAERSDIKLGSERSFGFVFTFVFLIVGLFPLLSADGRSVELHFWALSLAGFFGISAVFLPKILRPLNKLWFRFGKVLHHFINPLILGFMFFGVISPIAFIMRVLGKIPLKTKFDHNVKSYWILRRPPGPTSNSMKRQF